MRTLVIAFAVLLAGCDMEPPRTLYVCDRTETRMELQLECTGVNTGGGIPIGSGCHEYIRPVTRCKAGHEVPNPDWAAWHERELTKEP